MAREVRNIQSLYDIYRDTVIAESGDLTDFSPGSIHDILAGAFSVTLNEISELLINEFRKTFIDTARGDDLESLAIDHFGSTFARPQATPSTTEITFSRPNNNAGDVLIPTGTIISTNTDANGISIEFATDSEATLTGTEVSVSATAQTTGANTNVGAGTIINLDSPLTDGTVTATNAQASAGGDDAEDDSTYRETIRSLILSLAGATKSSLRGALLAVPEIDKVALVEESIPVIEYDFVNETPVQGASWFRYPNPIAYVADQEGRSSPELIRKGEEALNGVKACGVSVRVLGAAVVEIDWEAEISLNPDGPNFTALSNSTQRIIETMEEYANIRLNIGESFIISTANAYILSVWGAAGTNDLKTFETQTPSANIFVPPNGKIILKTAVAR